MAVAIVCAVCSITINPGKVQAADFWPEAPDVQSASAIRDGGKYRHDPV